jgi:hypothetical protein
VTFERIQPVRIAVTHPVRVSLPQPQHIGWENAPSSPAVAHAPGARGEPVMTHQPIVIHPVGAPGEPFVHPIVHPVIHPVIHPAIHPPQVMPIGAPGMQRFPMQWQFQAPGHPVAPAMPAAPK